MMRQIAWFVGFCLVWLVVGDRPARGDDSVEIDPGTAALIDLLPQLEDSAAQLDILKGIRAGVQGRRQIAPPASWPSVYRDHLARSKNEEVRDLAQLLALQFGDEQVRQELLSVLSDEEAPLQRRREALAALAEIRASELPGRLHELLGGSALRPDALRTLAEFGNEQTPARIIDAYPNLNLQEKRIAIDALSSGVTAATQLLQAVQEEKIPRTDLNAHTIRRLKLLNDDSIDEAIAAHWGTVRQTPEAKAEQIAALKALLTSETDRGADLPRGRALFAKTCRQCHTLYGDGEKVGPEITGSNRSDLDYLLLNVVDPNATIGKDYQAWSVMTDAGKLHVGLIVAEDEQSLILRTETDTIHIPQDEIEFREQTTASMMPEGIFDQLSEQDLRDLVAYLRGNRQVPLLASSETSTQFFNGRDLTYWNVFGGDWRAADGQIHGTQGPAAESEAVLISDMLLETGVVEMEVRFAGRQGSAAIGLAPWNPGEDPNRLASYARPLVALEFDSNGAVGASVAVPELAVTPPGTVSAPSSDWHKVRIARLPDRFTVSVNGEELVTGPKGAMPRFRVGFVLEKETAGELTVRGLKLTVPPGR